MNNNILKNDEYAKIWLWNCLRWPPCHSRISFFFLGSGRPQTRFSSNVVFIFQKSLNVWKKHMSGSQACRGPTHGPIEKEMCHLKAEKNRLNHSGCLLSQILFHCFVCYKCMCIFFLFYHPTLSLLCMFQSYNLFCGWTSSCFFT